jgi:hypothetical protein
MTYLLEFPQLDRNQFSGRMTVSDAVDGSYHRHRDAPK